MHRTLGIISTLIISTISLAAQPADIRLSSLLLGSPILQRDMPVPVWGTAEPGKTISVQFGTQKLSSSVANDGTWRVTLAAMPANSQGQDLLVDYADAVDDTYTLTREDVLIGDIWIAAGQSNMEMGFSGIANRAEEIRDVAYPAIRLFLVPKSATPYDNVPILGAWLPADRRNLTSGGWYGFSAVGFTFARKLYNTSKIPIGIIQTAYGGSPIESWLSPQELNTIPETATWAQRLKDADAAWNTARQTDPEAKHSWTTVTDTATLEGSQIFKAMISPLGGMPIKGVIWYQGETNVGNGPAYTAKMAALIRTYRKAFNQSNLPFYFVQLAPYNYGGKLPTMWASQEAVLSIPGTGMVVSTDVGNPTDIHPTNKRPVGDRLALLALRYTYQNKEVLADSPTVQSVTPQGSVLRLTFLNAGTGLQTSDQQAPLGFQISADGKTWYNANGKIQKDTVLLSHPECPAPPYPKNAWVDTPTVNLVNSAGLPARPWGGN
jgi:sialate O-acetylesterase